MQVPPNGETEERDLECGHDELEDDQPGVAVDLGRVLPAEGQDVGWLGTAVGQLAGEGRADTPASCEIDDAKIGSCNLNL